MKTLRIGILPYEEMKARTLAIARGELRARQRRSKGVVAVHGNSWPHSVGA